MMSDTPRTDALSHVQNFDWLREHARTLERELAAIDCAWVASHEGGRVLHFAKKDGWVVEAVSTEPVAAPSADRTPLSDDAQAELCQHGTPYRWNCEQCDGTAAPQDSSSLAVNTGREFGDSSEGRPAVAAPAAAPEERWNQFYKDKPYDWPAHAPSKEAECCAGGPMTEFCCKDQPSPAGNLPWVEEEPYSPKLVRQWKERSDIYLELRRQCGLDHGESLIDYVAAIHAAPKGAEGLAVSALEAALRWIKSTHHGGPDDPTEIIERALAALRAAPTTKGAEINDLLIRCRNYISTDEDGNERIHYSERQLIEDIDAALRGSK